MKVLLVHAGGDSKRLPWANPMGKPFLPLPLLAGADPDGPPLTLFDHTLAVAALALTALPRDEGEERERRGLGGDSPRGREKGGTA